MSVRKVGERGFSDFLVCQREGLNETLDRLGAVIDWRSLEAVLAPVEPLKRGAPGYPALVLLRCLFLGELYGLSDPGLEAAISDRLSFRRFAGFPLDDAVPDHSTLWRFREDLRLAGLDKAVFEEIMGQLDDQGLIMRKGTILDATIIAAQASRPRKGDKTSTVDKDGAYRSAEIEDMLTEKGLTSRIHRKGRRNKPLTKRQEQGNKTRSKVRVRVEHVFGSQSNDMGGTLVRSIGIVRAKARIGLKNLTYNMRRLVQLERLATAPP